MSQKPIHIQLETSDDVPSVRDRLSFIRGQRVLLIWPEEGTVFTRKLDLVLIQREARRRAIQLALVTHDPVVTRNAQELGISTFETIGASIKARWKRGRTRVFIQRYHKPEDEPAPDQLMEAASRVRGHSKRLSGLRFTVGRILILLLLLGVIGLTAYFLLPGATITLMLSEETLTVDTIITADPAVFDIDIENQIIPAIRVRVSVETTSSKQTSGSQILNDLLAAGRVVFTNRTNEAVEIPAGTNVSTSAGEPILFRTVEQIIVPAGIDQRAEVDVEALQSSGGDAGNVDTGLINTVIGPLENSVTVRNLSPTSGGATRTIPIVTAEDQSSLLSIASQQIQSQAYNSMLGSLLDSQVVIIETIRLADDRENRITFSHQVGDASPTLDLTMRSVVEAIVVNDAFAQQVTLAQLSAQIPRGRILQPETFTYLRGGVLSVDDEQRVTFNASGSANVRGQVNTQQLQETLAGLSRDEAMQILTNRVDIATGTLPVITLWPDGFDRMPLIPLRIQIQVQNGS